MSCTLGALSRSGGVLPTWCSTNSPAAPWFELGYEWNGINGDEPHGDVTDAWGDLDFRDFLQRARTGVVKQLRAVLKVFVAMFDHPWTKHDVARLDVRGSSSRGTAVQTGPWTARAELGDMGFDLDVDLLLYEHTPESEVTVLKDVAATARATQAKLTAANQRLRLAREFTQRDSATGPTKFERAAVQPTALRDLLDELNTFVGDHWSSAVDKAFGKVEEGEGETEAKIGMPLFATDEDHEEYVKHAREQPRAKARRAVEEGISAIAKRAYRVIQRVDDRKGRSVGYSCTLVGHDGYIAQEIDIDLFPKVVVDDGKHVVSVLKQEAGASTRTTDADAKVPVAPKRPLGSVSMLAAVGLPVEASLSVDTCATLVAKRWKKRVRILDPEIPKFPSYHIGLALSATEHIRDARRQSTLQIHVAWRIYDVLWLLAEAYRPDSPDVAVVYHDADKLAHRVGSARLDGHAATVLAALKEEHVSALKKHMQGLVDKMRADVPEDKRPALHKFCSDELDKLTEALR